MRETKNQIPATSECKQFTPSFKVSPCPEMLPAYPLIATAATVLENTFQNARHYHFCCLIITFNSRSLGFLFT